MQEHQGLKVIVSQDLKIPTHGNAAAAKVFRVLWSLCRAFKMFDQASRILYTTYVRPPFRVQSTQLVYILLTIITHLSVFRVWEQKLVKGLSELPYDERLERLRLFPCLEVTLYWHFVPSIPIWVVIYPVVLLPPVLIVSEVIARMSTSRDLINLK